MNITLVRGMKTMANVISIEVDGQYVGSVEITEDGQLMNRQDGKTARSIDIDLTADDFEQGDRI